MKKKGGLKKKVVAIVALIAVMAMNIVPAFASDDNVAFSFTVKGAYANTYSAKRYRQTTNTSNKWKVNLAYSEEGVGTYTTFWLASSSDHDVVSGIHDVKQGSGDHYYNAYSTASESYVCLGAENNNYTTSTYVISGYWDEETN